MEYGYKILESKSSRVAHENGTLAGFYWIDLQDVLHLFPPCFKKETD